MHSRNFKTPKIKNMRRHRKKINELREEYNKHQSETKDTIKTEIYEFKMTTQNIKEELNEDMENLRKKNQTEILEINSPFSQTKNTVRGHSSRLEQVEDRISELKDKIEIKENQKKS
jgi:chromosome segregation ATPase